MLSNKIRVGIYGASGYMGGELIRVLLAHPAVELVWLTSRSAQDISDVHRNLYGSGLKFIKPEAVTPCDVVFLSVPSGHALSVAQNFMDQGTRVIDLGADFRLSDRKIWERVYGQEHTAWELTSQAVYGIPEFYRDTIKTAMLVANPGCYASAAIFGLMPLVQQRLIDPAKIVVDGFSGTAGAGADLDLTMHHPEIANNLVPYNVVDHRHTYEMEEQLTVFGSQKVTIHFTPTYVPISRGILDVCHAFPLQKTSRAALLELYKDFYKNEHFIQIFDLPKSEKASWQYKPYPWVAAVSGTNFCHIGLDYDEQRERIVVFSVLDSIGKGGAQAGVQNMNLLFGLDEKTGLERYGNHPY